MDSLTNLPGRHPAAALRTRMGSGSRRTRAVVLAAAVLLGGAILGIGPRAAAGAPYVWSTQPALVYKTPPPSGTVVATLRVGMAVDAIHCQVRTGVYRFSPWHERTDLWDQVQAAGTVGYVSDADIRTWTAGMLPGMPTCKLPRPTPGNGPGTTQASITEPARDAPAAPGTPLTQDFYVGPGCPSNSQQQFRTTGWWSPIKGTGCVNGGAYRATDASNVSNSKSSTATWTIKTSLARCAVWVSMPSYYEVALEQTWTVNAGNGASVLDASPYNGWEGGTEYPVSGGTISATLTDLVSGSPTGTYPGPLGLPISGGTFSFQINASTVRFHCSS